MLRVEENGVGGGVGVGGEGIVNHLDKTGSTGQAGGLGTDS